MLSISLAIFSTYTAFLISRHIRTAGSTKDRLPWLFAGTFSLGGGVWAMHFIGMLAYGLPIATSYSAVITSISVIPALFASFIILNTTHEESIRVQTIAWRSLLMGSGIGLMHYIGMMAMRVDGVMRYEPGLVIISVIVSVLLSAFSLRLKYWADKHVTTRVIFSGKLLIASIMMGFAISAMHYIGMAGVYVFPSPVSLTQTLGLSSTVLAQIVGSLSVLLGLLLIVVIEVNHRLNMYRQVKASERNLTITLDSIGDAVITTNTKGCITRMNPVAERLTEWSFEDAQNQPIEAIFSIINTTTRDVIKNPVDAVLSTGETFFLSNHTTLTSREGSEYQIAYSAAPIRIEKEEILGVVLIFSDVTESYRTRESLRRKDKEQSEILNSLEDSVITINETGEILSFNRSAEILFGYTRENIIGKNVKQLMPESFSIEHDAYLARYMETGKAHIIGVNMGREVVGLRKDGNSFPMRLTVVEIDKGEDGKSRFIGSCVDITEMKHQEELLRRTQKMDALGKLTGGIAHDYNNMLNVILGYAELLEENLGDRPELTNFIGEIIRASGRSSKLTKQLLNFSGESEQHPQVLNLNTKLQSLKDMLEKVVTPRIIVKYELADDLWQVNVDEDDLEDAILNMSINAMHATDANSSGQLTIQARNETIDNTGSIELHIRADDYVVLSISDTGSGMDEATLENIFDPFFSTKGDDGTGLGLSQVYGFVKRSGGTIKVVSKPGQGTTLSLYFPRYHDTNSEKLSKTSTNSTSNLDGIETILVVDDELALLGLASEMLSRKGYRVLTASDAAHALEILEQQAVDLLFSDVVMPGMNGYLLAEIVREKYPNIKVQLTSGYADNQDLKITDQYLHNNLLKKPYQHKDLLVRIRELLEGSLTT